MHCRDYGWPKQTDGFCNAVPACCDPKPTIWNLDTWHTIFISIWIRGNRIHQQEFSLTSGVAFLDSKYLVAHSVSSDCPNRCSAMASSNCAKQWTLQHVQSSAQQWNNITTKRSPSKGEAGTKLSFKISISWHSGVSSLRFASSTLPTSLTRLSTPPQAWSPKLTRISATPRCPFSTASWSARGI